VYILFLFSSFTFPLQRVHQYIQESAAKAQAAMTSGGSINWTAVTSNKVVIN
jgi:hypothetical protein